VQSLTIEEGLSPHSRVPAGQPGKLSDADAIDIWIARWLRIRPVDLIRRYRCDPRRLYEIWEEQRFPGSRAKALAVFSVRYPTLLGRVDCGAHRRISQDPDPDQLSFFEPVG
jgi:hypothetical protein